MKYQFFIPYSPPRRWTLLDVLFWVSCQKVPLSKFDSEGTEYRESSEVIFENVDWYGEVCLGELTRNDFTRLKIQEPKPSDFEGRKIEELKQLYSGADIFSEITKRKSTDTPRYPAIKERFKSLRKETHKYRAKWIKLNREKLDIWKIRLIISLYDDQITARGISITSGSTVLHEHPNIFSSDELFNSAFTTIPENFWISENIDWEQCSIRSANCDYFAINFDRDEILAKFPPTSEIIHNLFAFGDALVTKKRIGLSLAPPMGGKPVQYDWSAIDVKITECILREGGLIEPQDSLVMEIEKWHLNEYNKMIPRSTVAARLKPFYDSPYLKNISHN